MTRDEAIQETRNLFEIAYPPAQGQFPGNMIGPWIDKGWSPKEISDGLVKGMRALGFTVDPNGSWQGAKYKAFMGHYTLQDALNPYFMKDKDTFPADAYIRSRIISGAPNVYWDGTPFTPSTPKPPIPPTPPQPPPSAGTVYATREELDWLKRLVLESIQPRLDRLDKAVPPTSDPKKGGPGIGQP